MKCSHNLYIDISTSATVCNVGIQFLYVISIDKFYVDDPYRCINIVCIYIMINICIHIYYILYT